MPFKIISNEERKAQIKVVGVGGGGGTPSIA